MRVGGLIVALVLIASGCGGGQPSQPDNAGQGNSALAKACPETVVVQTNWLPQAEYGGLYRLLGDEPEIDTETKSASGPLLDNGAQTGVRLEIRSGGPANNYTPAAKVLYADDSVMIGGADIDQVIQVSGDQPVQAVFATMDVSPLVLMWDPKAYPDVRSIEDIGRTDATVLYYQGSTYMEYLTGTDVLKKSQVDPSYDGTPSRFVAERGDVIQQGFLTNEVFQYENELDQWNQKVDYELVSDAGYPTYPEALTVRSDKVAEYADCLKELVPLMQRGSKEYAEDPEPTNELIVDLVRQFRGFPYSMERATNAVDVMRQQGVLGNGSNQIVGDFDEARVERMREIVVPILTKQRVEVPSDLTARDLYTNEFIDKRIGLE